MIEISQRSSEVFTQVLRALIENGREQRLESPEIEIRDEQGARIATLTIHTAKTRPQDMPRAFRPKRKLSKRQRDKAKRAKLPVSM